MKVLLAALCLLASRTAMAGAIPDYYSVLSSVTVSFNGDSGFDRAVLVQPSQNSPQTDLYLYLSAFNPETKAYEGVLALRKDAVAFTGGKWGMQPYLSVNPRGSLEINSGNDGLGRIRWAQTLTVVYRNREFLVVGISHASRDTLDPDKGGHCDLNLLTGNGLRNGRHVAVSLKPVRLAEWRDDMLPKICQFE